MGGYHVPALEREVIELLDPQSGESTIDGTIGDGGHAQMILERTGPKGKLLGIDLDPRALETAEKRLEKFGKRVILTQGNYSSIEEIAVRENFEKVSIILLDLGLRTAELEDSGRGFSFKGDEPLDMRFNPASPFTAADLVNRSSRDELAQILSSFGEECLAPQIAAEIAAVRRDDPILRTSQLVKIILDVYKKKLHSKKEIPWIGGIHPATRTFQAIRIRVNDELEHLRASLPQALRLLSPGGRLAVISFHSLEDRIVKRFFKEQGRTVQLLNKKPIIPKEEEIKINPASRSAKLRVLKKIK